MEITYAGTGLQRGWGWVSGLGCLALIGLAVGLKVRKPVGETRGSPRRRANAAGRPQDGMPGRKRKR